MQEYEYSFKVKSIKKYLDYCENNGYINKSISTQNRKVYENKNNRKIIARITKNTIDGNEETLLDFKNSTHKENELKISLESVPIKLGDSNIDNYISLLELLEFELVADLYRTRYVYIKDDVEFEIDEYTSPKMNVIAIEGEKNKVDQEFKTLEDTLNKIYRVED